MRPALPLAAVTGLVLAGGRGQRMGGRDKGLVEWQGRPLVAHAVARLRPQVGSLAISANRHLDAYGAFGVPVWPDEEAGFGGPLAGVETALVRCATPWLACVPCDVPGLPLDLVARLAAAALAGDDVDAVCPETVDQAAGPQPQPIFMLLRVPARGPRPPGTGAVWRWLQAQRLAVVRFDDPAAFRGANSAAELAALGGPS